MRRYVIGGLVGIAAWFGTGQIAFAQSGVDGYEPTKVHVSDSSSVYKATVTTANSFWFHLRVFLEGTQKHYTRTLVITSGPTYTVVRTVSNMDSWGMSVNDELDYFGLAQGPGGSPSDHHYVTVEEDPITFRAAPDRVKFQAEPWIDRFRGVLA